MKIVLRTLAALIVAAGSLAPTLASAACIQSELSGVWQAYVFSVNGGAAAWASCRITVAVNGNIANTNCTTSAGINAPLTQGKLTLNDPALCRFTATFKVGPTVNKVTHATLARGHVSADGVGFIGSTAFFFALDKINQH